MKKILTSNKVYVGKSKILNAGRGVFAKCDIKINEVIERCPIIKVPKHDMSNLNESILVTYFFYYGTHKERLLVALGFGSIYNHAYKPNAKYNIKQKEGIIEFVALDKIKKNKEITVNYNKHGNSKNPLWFETI